MPELTRLNKFLAHTFGISRREADNAIEQGRVMVNQHPARLGMTVDASHDRITLDKKRATKTANYTYLLLNKPVGYVCSRRQQGDTPTIYQLLPTKYHSLKVAGRLDKDSCGLLLLTDDGDTIFRLTHPKFNKKKIYHVGLDKPLTEVDRQQIEKGVQLEDGLSKLTISSLNVVPAQAETSKERSGPPAQAGNDAHSAKYHLPNTAYQVTMHEGRNRQIRRTFKALGYTITRLERHQLGVYSLGDIAPAHYTAILP